MSVSASIGERLTNIESTVQDTHELMVLLRDAIMGAPPTPPRRRRSRSRSPSLRKRHRSRSPSPRHYHNNNNSRRRDSRDEYDDKSLYVKAPTDVSFNYGMLSGIFKSYATRGTISKIWKPWRSQKLNANLCRLRFTDAQDMADCLADKDVIREAHRIDCQIGNGF